MIFFNKQSKVKLIKQENGRKPAHPEKKIKSVLLTTMNKSCLIQYILDCIEKKKHKKCNKKNKNGKYENNMKGEDLPRGKRKIYL